MNKNNLESTINVYRPGFSYTSWSSSKPEGSEYTFIAYKSDGTPVTQLGPYYRHTTITVEGNGPSFQVDEGPISELLYIDVTDTEIAYVEFSYNTSRSSTSSTTDRIYYPKLNVNNITITSNSISNLPGGGVAQYALVKSDSSEELDFLSVTSFSNLESNTDYTLIIKVSGQSTDTTDSYTLYNKYSITTTGGEHEVYINTEDGYVLGAIYTNTGTKYIEAEGIEINI